MEATEVYVMRERVQIVKEVRADYLIEDVTTGRQYLVDKTYFHRHYITENDLIPVHTEIWEKLQNQALQIHQLKRANTKIRNELRKTRRILADMENTQKEKKHYRNGRKRGKYGRNG